MSLVIEPTAADVLSDFLSSAPSLTAIAQYRLPEALQERAHLLLEKQRDGTLSESERAEVDAFRHVDHLLTLVKAKARLRLAGVTAHGRVTIARLRLNAVERLKERELLLMLGTYPCLSASQ